MACTPHRDSEMKMSMLYCTRIICLVWLHEPVTANCMTQGDVLCQQQFILFTFFSKPTHPPPDFRLKLWGTNELTRQRLGFENNYLSKQISKRQP